MSRTSITVMLGGVPVAKGRARFGRGHAYTPTPTRNFERSLAWAAKSVMAGRPPLAGAARLSVLFELAIPKSWTAAQRKAAIAGSVRPTTKPDTDNLLKSVLDAVNGVVVEDDAQITEIAAQKVYGTEPRTILAITPLNRTKAMPDLTRLLQEFSTAASQTEIGIIAARAVEAVAALPVSEREGAMEQVQDAISEWCEPPS